MPQNPSQRSNERPAPINGWPLTCFCGLLTHNVGVDNQWVCLLPCKHLICDECYGGKWGEEWFNCPDCHELTSKQYVYALLTNPRDVEFEEYLKVWEERINWQSNYFK